MAKRILALFLCFVLLAAAFPLTAYAQEADDQAQQEREEEEQQIRDRITDFYWKILRVSGQYTLEGWCGLMAGWELYLLGVTKHPMTYNGNDQFDVYRKMDTTDMGYKVQAYPMPKFTIEESLNTITRCGTMDAYNLLGGFQQTRTAAGQLWGHVNIIHAVLDGTVYYTEGFDTPYGLKPEEAQVCSIAEWAEFYDMWASFEGMVHFGTKAYLDFCTYYPADLFLVTKAPVQLWTQPGGEEAKPLRTALAGEKLHAIGIYENPEGKLYYQLQDDGICYITPENTQPWQYYYEDISLQGLVLPQTLEQGTDFEVAGKLYGYNKHFDQIGLQILSSDGTMPVEYLWEKDSCFFDLGQKTIQKTIDFSKLEPGSYTARFFARAVNHSIASGKVEQQTKTFTLATQGFTVGEGFTAPTPQAQEVISPAVTEGWHYEEGGWRFYEAGAPRTGWLRENGLSYYLKPDGMAATGWEKIHGAYRCFTPTGAMITGWLDTDAGRMYLLRNGVAATGWFEIEGVLYCFSQEGRLLTEQTAQYQGVSYVLGPDGAAVPAE